MEDWRQTHLNLMKAFLGYLNQNNDCFILKGETALMMCYGLDRFSEDIDLDALSTKIDILQHINYFCSFNNITCRIAKNTDTVKRCFLHYNGKKPLKIEVSYRRSNVNSVEYTYINGILVYTIQSIAIFKLNAYLGRDKIRDLYDITFIFKNYIKVLLKSVVTQMYYAIEQKGLEQFDFVIKDQQDDLINNDKLATDFLELYYYLGFK